MNLILESEKYPSSSCRNILVTLYKGGGNDDPDNYRGISVGSCLAKLYSTVLYPELRIRILGPEFLGLRTLGPVRQKKFLF